MLVERNSRPHPTKTSVPGIYLYKAGYFLGLYNSATCFNSFNFLALNDERVCNYSFIKY
jgi:hypothetical protein